MKQLIIFHISVINRVMWALMSVVNLVLISPILLCVMSVIMLPVTLASSAEAPFPDIPFKTFSQFITQNFSSKISLSTALVILFSLTENTDLLNLHARQQYVKCQGEHRVQASGWILALARTLWKQINTHQTRPLKMKNVVQEMDEDQALSLKLDSLAKVLRLHPYDSNEQLQEKLQPISHKSIQSSLILCPNAMECQTLTCKSRSLQQITPVRDIPYVTLIKGTIIYEGVPVLTGQCAICKTKYFADHERAIEGVQNTPSRLYLNSAKYLKVG
jgi:hypothetical protein